MSLSNGVDPNRQPVALVDEFWSGFQSGVDQAVMELASERGKTLRGWVPDRFRAEVRGEDGAYRDQDFGIPEHLYSRAGLFLSNERDVNHFLRTGKLSIEEKRGVEELLDSVRDDPTSPALRTELLVLSTDASLIITSGHPSLTDGTNLMESFCRKHGKPHYSAVLGPDGKSDRRTLQETNRFLNSVEISRLNVGGPRESHSGECGYSVGSAARAFMEELGL